MFKLFDFQAFRHILMTSGIQRCMIVSFQNLSIKLEEIVRNKKLESSTIFNNIAHRDIKIL